MTSIITGDIINSRKASIPEDYLNDIKKEFNRHGNSPKTWEIYRGDSFQLEVSDPLIALETAIKLKAIVKQYKELDVRMAIGIGEKSYEAEKITESNGDAFIFSGKTFDQSLKKEVTLAIKSNWQEFDKKINLFLKLALSFMNSWSEKSAEAVELYFNNPNKSQKELAKLLGKGQSTVSERLDRANFHLVTEVIEAYKIDLEKILNH